MHIRYHWGISRKKRFVRRFKENNPAVAGESDEFLEALYGMVIGITRSVPDDDPE
jgi:hypothetical protein